MIVAPSMIEALSQKLLDQHYAPFITAGALVVVTAKGYDPIRPICPIPPTPSKLQHKASKAIYVNVQYLSTPDDPSTQNRTVYYILCRHLSA